MSPRPADPSLRAALIDEGARLIAVQGSRGLTLRRLTSAVGVSTMAVYTHFGNMDELRRAIRAEGFARLANRMDAVGRSDDAVADLILLGWAYFTHGTTEPNLYRAMFVEHCIDADEAVGYDTFERLVAAVDRCIASGRFRPADPTALASQLWAMEHGVVTLLSAGFLPAEEARACFRDLSANLFTAFGDDPDSLRRSVARAAERSTPPSRAPTGARPGDRPGR